VQRIGCVGDSDRMLRPNEFTELPFEGFGFGAAGQEIGAKCANDSSDIVFVNGLAAVGEHEERKAEIGKVESGKEESGARRDAREKELGRFGYRLKRYSFS
jgi:hypothetical protein